MERARSNLVASGAPASFWTYAVAHSVDVLNRTTGPPHSPMSSYECLTGVKPRIMPILPFGCRAFAVTERSLLENAHRTQSVGRHESWAQPHLARSLQRVRTERTAGGTHVR
eukprot:4376929-Pleurochrysis_carterae.AAC.1